MTESSYDEGLRLGPIGLKSLHLCVDMQELFGPTSPWAVPWMETILPSVARLASQDPERTLFTRFIPPREIGDAVGSWANYYANWPQLLRNQLDPDQLLLRRELRDLVPPARIFDRLTYSPWADGRLHRILQQGGISTLIVTGGETDICVLASVMGAVDRGYRVIIVADCVCSSTDMGHDAAMTLYRNRLEHQIEIASLEEISAEWRG